MATESQYERLMAELEELRERTARFRKVALHIHSPDSVGDWPKNGADKTLNDPSRLLGADGPREFASQLQKRLDFAAITDHMRSGYACRVSACNGTRKDFVVVPGMEVNFRSEAALGCARIHLLVILREGSDTEAFARLFAGQKHIPSDGQRSGQEEVRDIPLKEWIKRVHNEGGICIAAHVDSDSGVRRLFRQTARDVLQLFIAGDPGDAESAQGVGDSLKNYLFDSGLDAVEIADVTDEPHYQWVSESGNAVRSIATVLTFDAHCIEGLDSPERVTHIKMTRLGLSGLKSALEFPDTRIRFPQALPPRTSPYVAGIQILGEKAAFFENMTIAFAENLNCLIGSRGSGKSTVVEAMRYVFGYNRTLEKLEQSQAKQIVELQAANLGDSLIRVVYRMQNGEYRVLEATFDAKSDYATRVYKISGDYVEVADVEAYGEFPLRLFGWSEIESLGRIPSKQRDLLDLLIPGLGQKLKEKRDIRQRLLLSRADIDRATQTLKAAYTQSDSEIRKYREYKSDFEKINTDEVKSLFEALDLVQAKRSLLAKVTSNATDLLEQLGDPATIELAKDTDSVLEKAEDALKQWWIKECLPGLGLLQAQEDVRGAAQRTVDLLNGLIDNTRRLDGKAAQEQVAIEQTLRARLAADPTKQRVADLRSNAEKRLRHVTGLRKNYVECLGDLKQLLEDRQEILRDLVRTQKEIGENRIKSCGDIETKLNRFLPHSMQVTIRTVPGGDTEKAALKMSQLLKSFSKYKTRQLAESLVKRHNPVEIAELLRNKGFGEGGFGEGGYGGSAFTEVEMAELAEAGTLFEPDEFADIQVLAEDGSRLNFLLELEETDWDDAQEIDLNGRPISETSPGQRSSAMLPLIALSETTPLVIDQPEDNLDKRLIGQVLAKVLAQLKENRQIIVCTHDPNILVGGDAEQVVVLEAITGRKGKVADMGHGSIDNDNIVNSVIELLEGGREAFKNRHKRYSNVEPLAD